MRRKIGLGMQGGQAVYLIETGERISGNMPPNKEKLIQAKHWIPAWPSLETSLRFFLRE